jgi:hypothetical protein
MTDAGLVTVIIAVAVSLILIVIGSFGGQPADSAIALTLTLPTSRIGEAGCQQPMTTTRGRPGRLSDGRGS